MLIDKKAELEKTIRELENERASLPASMRVESVSDEEGETLFDFTRRVSAGLENADANFKTRRGVIEALKVETILACEDREKTLRIKCILGEEYCALSPALSVVLSLAT